MYDSERIVTFLQPFLIGLLLLVTTTCLAASYWSSSKRTVKKNAPPGPIRLPLLGYLPFLTKEPDKKLVKLSHKFQSSVIGIYLGNRYTVVLNDFPSVKEALLQDACLGRPHGTAFELLSDAISMNDVNGPPWKENRRTTVRILRDLGFDKINMETQIRFEVEEFLEFLKSSEGRCLDIHYKLTSSVSNNITWLVFGERLSFDDERRRLLDDYMLCISSFLNQTSLHACYPWLKKILFFFNILNYDRAKLQLQRFLAHVQKEIETHRNSAGEENETKDYIDGYLKTMKKKDNPSTPYLSNRFLKGNIRSLFGAGTEPVRCTLEWCFLVMAHFKDYQVKIHEELDQNLGPQRKPSMINCSSTPLTTATIYEVVRWLAVVPFSHVRCALEETKIGGKDIPKDSIILVNLYAVHNDPTLWDEPEIFRPERFINKENKAFRPEYFIPFGIGKRSCPGENMVYIELYIYFATIMQSFSILPPEGETISFDCILGIAKQAKSPRLRFNARQT